MTFFVAREDEDIINVYKSTFDVEKNTVPRPLESIRYVS